MNFLFFHSQLKQPPRTIVNESSNPITILLFILQRDNNVNGIQHISRDESSRPSVQEEKQKNA